MADQSVFYLCRHSYESGIRRQRSRSYISFQSILSYGPCISLYFYLLMAHYERIEKKRNDKELMCLRGIPDSIFCMLLPGCMQAQVLCSRINGPGSACALLRMRGSASPGPNPGLLSFSFPLLARTGESSREAVTIRSSWPEEKKEERKVSSLAIRR